jgi:ADP-ribose pyrophosphatase
MPDKILAETKYLRLIDRDGWYFVERPMGSGVVIIVPITNDGNVVLVEQFRPAIGRTILELPAGLVGDEVGQEAEAMESAARRELIEETGYLAAKLEPLVDSISAPGISSEVVSFYRATGLTKVGPGGGVASEQIKVIEVPRAEVHTWLMARAREGAAIAVKVWAGLWLAEKA